MAEFESINQMIMEKQLSEMQYNENPKPQGKLKKSIMVLAIF